MILYQMKDQLTNNANTFLINHLQYIRKEDKEFIFPGICNKVRVINV